MALIDDEIMTQRSMLLVISTACMNDDISTVDIGIVTQVLIERLDQLKLKIDERTVE